MRLEVIVIGMTMGLAFAAPPGIVTTETLRRGLRGGFAHALSVQAGSLIGDASYALIALAGLAALLQSALTQLLIGSAGVLVLLYLAWQSLRSASAGLGTDVQGSVNYRDSFLSGMLLSLTNPWAIAFWISIGGSFVALGLRTTGDVSLAFASFVAGAVLWSIVLSTLIERGRHMVSIRMFRFISVVCSALLAAFALGSGAHLVSTILVH